MNLELLLRDWVRLSVASRRMSCVHGSAPSAPSACALRSSPSPLSPLLATPTPAVEAGRRQIGCGKETIFTFGSIRETIFTLGARAAPGVRAAPGARERRGGRIATTA